MDAAGTTTSAILRTDVLHPVEDDGGLIKEVHAEGSGELPQTGYEIKAHYTGRLLDGTVFDSSVSRGVPFTFTLGQGQVIRGWDDGFASMRKGEKALLRCGPGYAYGVGGSPPKIPGNATLEFTVELLSFSAPPRDFSSLPAREQLAAGEENKAAGNAAFTRGDLAAALEAYNEGWRAVETTTDEAPWGGDEPALSADEATALRSLKVTLKSNLAMVHLKSKAWAEAAESASAALAVDPAHAKSLFRRGTARAHLGDLPEAKADLLAAARLAPGDAAIAAELQRIKGLAAEALAKEKKMFGGGKLFK